MHAPFSLSLHLQKRFGSRSVPNGIQEMTSEHSDVVESTERIASNDFDKYIKIAWKRLSRAIFGIIVCYIGIYHECEGGIEKSVPRIAVWHHEAC